jgi:hypothetical protein
VPDIEVDHYVKDLIREIYIYQFDMSMAKEKIVLDDRNTWPQAFENLILPDAIQISKERAVERSHQLEGKSWLSTVATSKYISVKQEMALLLERYTVKAYHCTRLLNTEKILRKGLFPLKDTTFVETMQEALKTDGSTPDSAQEEAAIELNNYIQRDEFLNNQGKLWFYLSEVQTEEFACHDLFEYYGGRVARAALANKRFRYYPLLKKIGTPALISARVSLADGTAEQLEGLAEQLVDYILDEEENRPVQPIRAELSISKPLHPEDIIELNEWELAYSQY